MSILTNGPFDYDERTTRFVPPVRGLGDVFFGPHDEYVWRNDSGWTLNQPVIYPTKTKDNDMSFTNPQAAEIAREILDEQTKGDLRERVTAAVAHLTELIKDTTDGSVLTFAKVSDGGKRFHYATVKSGGHWYTTSERPRVLHNDGQLIEWLIGLEIYEDNQLELRPGAPVSVAIEATATES
jgi:hypothetical protein